MTAMTMEATVNNSPEVVAAAVVSAVPAAHLHLAGVAVLSRVATSPVAQGAVHWRPQSFLSLVELTHCLESHLQPPAPSVTQCLVALQVSHFLSAVVSHLVQP